MRNMLHVVVHLAGYTSRRLGVGSADVLCAVSELIALLLDVAHVLSGGF